MPLFYIGFKDFDVGYDGEVLVHKEICTNILLEILFGNSSEFYQELYEEGFINSNFGFQYLGYKDYGFAILAGESKNPKEVHNRVLENVEKVMKKGIAETDFVRAKKKLIGYHITDFNSIDNIATSYINYFYKNFNLLNYLGVLESITIQEIEDRCKGFLKEKSCCLSIVNPK